MIKLEMSKEDFMELMGKGGVKTNTHHIIESMESLRNLSAGTVIIDSDKAVMELFDNGIFYATGYGQAGYSYEDIALPAIVLMHGSVRGPWKK